MLGMHERSCWRLAALAEAGRGQLPRPLRTAPKTVRWRLADVEAYLASLAGGPCQGFRNSDNNRLHIREEHW